MSLKEYQRKRKFHETPEPKGKKARPGKNLRFVVHQHAATRLHFDFRIEIDGTFKSWAVPKGPSLNPLDQRLAIFVEDHPLEYGSFEGIIPKGNYGAGTVMIWDEGTYLERNAKTRKESEDALRKGFAKGHLTLLLEGKKLRGEFALVKLKKGDEKTWLLLKKRDEHKSYRDVTQENLSARTGRTMEEIALQSTTKKSIWLTKAKHAVKETKRKAPLAAKSESMPRRVRPMLPAFAATVPKEPDWTAEPFPEGLRAIAEVERGSAHLYSRHLLPFDRKFPKIVEKLRALEDDLVLDGVIVDKKQKSTYRVFDLLFKNGRDLRSLPLSERKEALRGLKIFDSVVTLNPPEGKEENLLLRRADSPYTTGTSKDWLKIKVEKTKTASNPQAGAPLLTHLTKVYWPDEGYTKGDLIGYYRKVAPVILPHLVDRPQSLHRHPDGIKHAGFFHKDMTGYLPRWIKTIRIPSGSSGRTINYLLCQNEATLLYLANYGCIELNPWLSRVKKLENPDYIVIDLDPDDNAFEEVIEVAKEVQKVLAVIGAMSCCKTSGATGLHICIPTQGRYDFETGRAFAQTICTLVQKQMPEITSIERSPSKRRHRIYLDFLQNRRAQTLAAPYCVRPRPGATVSCPLHWREVKRGLTPAAFTIHTMPPRLKKMGDLWKPMLTSVVDIPACARKLASL